MEANDGTANSFAVKMTLTVSESSATESTVRVTKHAFNEDPDDSVIARQLEPWQPRTKTLIGCLEICNVFFC